MPMLITKEEFREIILSSLRLALVVLFSILIYQLYVCYQYFAMEEFKEQVKEVARRWSQRGPIDRIPVHVGRMLDDLADYFEHFFDLEFPLVNIPEGFTNLDLIWLLSDFGLILFRKAVVVWLLVVAVLCVTACFISASFNIILISLDLVRNLTFILVQIIRNICYLNIELLILFCYFLSEMIVKPIIWYILDRILFGALPLLFICLIIKHVIRFYHPNY